MTGSGSLTRPTRAAPPLAALAVAAWLVLVGRPAAAHELSRSTSRITVDGAIVEVVLTLGAVDFHQGPPVDTSGDGRVSVAEIDAAIGPLFDTIGRHLRVTAGGAAARAITLARYELLDSTTLRLRLRYEFPAPVDVVELTSTLPAVTQADHRHFATLVRGGQAEQAVLDAAVTAARFAPRAPSPWATMRRFGVLGVEHIATGYDHLAFLIVLLVGAASLRSVVAIVTAFTVAHSLTLGLAVFDLVALPPRAVEMAIAASIAWVAAGNVLTGGAPGRWPVAFLFGLVHGFGFAGVLRDLGLPRDALALSLVSFNLGVEAGQLAFVLLTFPLLWLVRRSAWRDAGVLTASAAVLCLGVFWFVQRWLSA